MTYSSLAKRDTGEKDDLYHDQYLNSLLIVDNKEYQAEQGEIPVQKQ